MCVYKRHWRLLLSTQNNMVKNKCLFSDIDWMCSGLKPCGTYPFCLMAKPKESATETCLWGFDIPGSCPHYLTMEGYSGWKKKSERSQSSGCHGDRIVFGKPRMRSFRKRRQSVAYTVLSRGLELLTPSEFIQLAERKKFEKFLTQLLRTHTHTHTMRWKQNWRCGWKHKPTSSHRGSASSNSTVGYYSTLKAVLPQYKSMFNHSKSVGLWSNFLLIYKILFWL